MVDIDSAFKELSEEAHDLYLPSRIRELDATPSPLVFLREYVMPNIPVIIREGVKHWPALVKWNDDYLTKILGKDYIVFLLNYLNAFSLCTDMLRASKNLRDCSFPQNTLRLFFLILPPPPHGIAVVVCVRIG